jgi:hypothetical protein
LVARTFARYFLTPGPTFMNATAAYLEINPNVTQGSAWTLGSNMLKEPRVIEAIEAQLKAIDKAADLDEQWVYDRWRAIANANIFDYITVQTDGTVDFKNFDPAHLTLDQQLAIREVKIDPKTGRVCAFKLASVDQAVLNVARARGVIDSKREAGSADRASKITERMNRAAKLLEHRMTPVES